MFSNMSYVVRHCTSHLLIHPSQSDCTHSHCCMVLVAIAICNNQHTKYAQSRLVSIKINLAPILSMFQNVYLYIYTYICEEPPCVRAVRRTATVRKDLCLSLSRYLSMRKKRTSIYSCLCVSAMWQYVAIDRIINLACFGTFLARGGERKKAGERDSVWAWRLE